MTSNTTPTRYLALDIGTVRLGLAISSKDGKLALPLDTIHLKKTANHAEVIRDIMARENITSIVVGMPLALDGKEKEAAKRVRKFVQDLKKTITNAKWYAQDERFSSEIAENTLAELHTKSKNKKNLVDNIAASLILQTYIDRIQKKARATNENP